MIINSQSQNTVHLNYNVRAIAAKLVEKVLYQEGSLSILLPLIKTPLNKKDQALLQELCFGIMRFLPKIEWLLYQLIKKPLTGKRRLIHCLLMVGIYQLTYMRIPPHAALSETVEGAVALKKPELKGLINGVLRHFQRQKISLLDLVQRQELHHLHPPWLKQRIQIAWPVQYTQIINANNQRPPMWIRVNRRHHSRHDYLKLLTDKNIDAVVDLSFPDAIGLKRPCNVECLPGFYQGWVTVQDASAQGCACLLSPQNGETILDLCAAPGGKTCHILEIAPEAKVTAVDVDKNRVARMYSNFQRLGMQAEVIVGDGLTPDRWCNGRVFDRILLDAPCSATGIIRRHPDIKWLRRNSDIEKLAEVQRKILCAAWKILKPGGIFLYSTCSILPEENRDQIVSFLASHPDSQLLETGDATEPGLQYLPSPTAGDGFFYAKMIKSKQ